MRKLFLLVLSLGAAASLHARVNVPDWVREAARTPVPANVGDAKAVVLLDSTNIEVVSPTSITLRHSRVLKILTAAGRDAGYAAVGFDRDTKLGSLHGWSIDPKGVEYEVKERDAVETSPYNGELFSDTRMKILRIPAADPGSIVAWEYTQSERPYLLQSLWMFQDSLPVARARFNATYPPGWTHEVRWANHDAVAPLTAGTASWELRDVPAVADEPRMPAAEAVAGRMAIDFIPPSGDATARAQRSWGEIARFFWSLASTRNNATPELQKKVHELVPEPAKKADAVRTLGRFAQRDVRYVAVEIGIGGYQPHAAGDVFSNRYGDCKDKATLLRTMLREVGVESEYVLVHTTRGVVAPDLPTMFTFNHVISAIRVPADAPKWSAIIEHPKLGKLLLFDPTSTTTPLGSLPSYLQGSRGLLVTPDGGELIELPALDAETNQLRRKATLQLDESGTLSGRVEEVRTGHIAGELRSALQSLNEAERQRFMESVMSAHLAHYSVAGLTIENLDDTDSDLIVKYDVKAPNYATRVAGMLLVRPRVIGQKGEGVIDLAKRTLGYVTEGPSVQTDEVEIALPSPLAVDELPAPVSMKTSAVDYASKSEFHDGKLRYHRRYALHTFFVPRESIPELNKAFTTILADERASAVLK
ncbi:MAG TPA: DUF3857 domain-containing protein [Thermoanaerobaculia bacterium]|jgi:hypothetical protein